MVILMALFNFFSHGSQDLYPSFLIKQLNYSTTEQTVTSVIYNIGGIGCCLLSKHGYTNDIHMIHEAIAGGTILGKYTSRLEHLSHAY